MRERRGQTYKRREANMVKEMTCLFDFGLAVVVFSSSLVWQLS